MGLTRLDDEGLPTALCEDWHDVDLIELEILDFVTIHEEGLLVREDFLKCGMPLTEFVQACVTDVLVHLVEVVLGALVVILDVILAAPLEIPRKVREHIFVLQTIGIFSEALQKVF